MVGEVSESFFDLLDQEAKDGLERESSDKTHPVRECHMVQINPVVIRDSTVPGAPLAGPTPNNDAEQANIALPPDLMQLHLL